MYQVKKRLLIICSIIGVLLAGFQFPIYAETTPPDYSSSTSIMSSTPLDQYFYDNYESLPYIEGNNGQYINLGYSIPSNYSYSLRFGSLVSDNKQRYLLGSQSGWDSGSFTVKSYISGDNNLIFIFDQDSKSVSYSFNSYSVYELEYKEFNYSINDTVLTTFEDNTFDNGVNFYLFALDYNGTIGGSKSSYRLYSFKVWDENNGLIHDYYPARSKSGGVIGLYDSVNKTFITASGSVPFDSPVGDSVNLSLGASISQFLSGSLSWIGAIFEGINEMPIIWVFIAIGLAGVAFRWGRRIVHF